MKNNGSNEIKYKRTFDSLHLSDDFESRLNDRIKDLPSGTDMEDTKMKKSTVKHMSKAAAIALAVGMVALGSLGVSYAADLGGIRTTFTMWVKGEQKEVTAEKVSDYEYNFYDENGEMVGGGGGVAYVDGKEVPLTAEEIAKDYASAELTENDGRIIFTYKNIEEDVTDLIDEEGNLYLHVIAADGEDVYVDMNYDRESGGYSCTMDGHKIFGTDKYTVLR